MPKRYENIETWKDLEDNRKLYEKGAPYPRPANKKVTKERIDELSSAKNKAGKPLIREITEEKEGE